MMLAFGLHYCKILMKVYAMQRKVVVGLYIKSFPWKGKKIVVDEKGDMLGRICYHTELANPDSAA